MDDEDRRVIEKMCHLGAVVALLIYECLNAMLVSVICNVHCI